MSFPSGSGETLLPPEHSKVGDLKMLAQRSLGRGFLKLVTIDGHVLTNPEVSLQAAELQDGQHLTAVAQEAKIATTGSAFAVWCCGGNKVLSWGNPDYGGDCSAVQDQLRNVQQIQATDHAFAAMLADGSVVAWGNGMNGGCCSKVQDQLRNVQQIQATAGAFAAILADRSLVVWGAPVFGGDCRAVQDQLRNVQQIQATSWAFAAILADRSVVAWGNVTAAQFRISSGMCRKFSTQIGHLPRSCPMDQWLPGAIQSTVVTAPQFKSSSKMCSKCSPLELAPLPPS